MKGFVEFIVRELVDKPEFVSVKEHKTEKMVIIELSVAKDEIGKIIGKEGRTVEAIRTLIQNVSMKKRITCILHIPDDNRKRVHDRR